MCCSESVRWARKCTIGLQLGMMGDISVSGRPVRFCRLLFQWTFSNVGGDPPWLNLKLNGVNKLASGVETLEDVVGNPPQAFVRETAVTETSSAKVQPIQICLPAHTFWKLVSDSAYCVCY
jgi:hypothetical protein